MLCTTVLAMQLVLGCSGVQSEGECASDDVMRQFREIDEIYKIDGSYECDYGSVQLPVVAGSRMDYESRKAEMDSDGWGTSSTLEGFSGVIEVLVNEQFPDVELLGDSDAAWLTFRFDPISGS